MGWKSQANKLRAIHPNLNKNEISGRVLGQDRFESSAAETINIEGIFSTSFVMVYPTIQFIILIIKVGGRLQHKKEEKTFIAQLETSNLT